MAKEKKILARTLIMFFYNIKIDFCTWLIEWYLTILFYWYEINVLVGKKGYFKKEVEYLIDIKIEKKEMKVAQDVFHHFDIKCWIFACCGVKFGYSMCTVPPAVDFSI